PGAFDPRTLTSYPALSFLLYTPLVWLGLPDILLLNLLVFVALAVWLVRHAPPGERVWSALALSAALPLLLYSLIADTEVVALAFVLLAWRLRERRWVSAIALGLGCAFRQYCWFFAPFFLLDALMRHGWREALRRAGIALSAFLLPNLPYLIASPSAWWTSLWLPIAEPLFPLGVGLVALSKGHLLPYAPIALYTALEVAALLACLWAQWRWRERLHEAVPLLALIPLYFAWRSLPNYFAIVPLLALFAVGALLRTQSERAPVTVVASGADSVRLVR
ncbi:MAG TPA: glycosyltransferase 87 family protein, partial [Ktedonobacterales bacterium]|nr:glycosyltransferase 87 family protein [Ktedonobacterales bacterium]